MDESTQTQKIYIPVEHHWFYNEKNEGSSKWMPFSFIDSQALESAFHENKSHVDVVVPVEGTRFDVNIEQRLRTPVYWKGEPSIVQRCSWFHKINSGDLTPYDESVSQKLEQEYKSAFDNDTWPKNVELENGDTITFHKPDIIVMFPAGSRIGEWGNTQNPPRPRTIKRGVKDFEIDKGEPAEADHILFMVHGIGSVCDLKLRSVEEAVNDFRDYALQLVKSHYKSSCQSGKIRRVEILPINWHDKLHSLETGIDKQLKGITLSSIPKLREFTNETLLDVLFYTSPTYCQHIVMAVCNEVNRSYELYKKRNPWFKGEVSMGGHSLGSLILFDLLVHQKSKAEETPVIEENGNSSGNDSENCEPNEEPLKRKISRRISYMMGREGTGQPEIHYPILSFEPKTFFALGSPIGMFAIIRGLDTFGETFSLPTCPGFFNIFHPYDPIAYRIEPLIRSDIHRLKPVLVPHHKGRKRMHIELKETMERVGADLKQRFYESMKSTWNSFFQVANPAGAVEEIKEEEASSSPQPDISNFGNLNNGRRIDYVLQEAPYEFFNDYLFALHSHVCYWDSEDTILFMIKEVYSSMGVVADSQIPQQTMTVERISESKEVNTDGLKNSLDDLSEESSAS